VVWGGGRGEDAHREGGEAPPGGHDPGVQDPYGEGHDELKSDTWFLSVNNAARNTRSTADPLNLRIQPDRLEVRRHFFSNRVVEDWNRIPSSLKWATAR
jgi:hypothetical protein